MLQTFDQRAKFLQRFFIFFGKLKQHTGIGNLGLKTLLAFNLLFQDAATLQEFLRAVLVIPKIRRRGFLLDAA